MIDELCEKYVENLNLQQYLKLEIQKLETKSNSLCGELLDIKLLNSYCELRLNYARDVKKQMKHYQQALEVYNHILYECEKNLIKCKENLNAYKTRSKMKGKWKTYGF